MKKVEFRESQYQSFIEYSLRDAFREDGRFEIVHYQGASENKRGYDLEVRSLIPLFLQIKIADFHPSFSHSTHAADRTALGFRDNPGFFRFKLHPDRKTRTYRQHNLLAALHGSGHYARYISPLFHTRRMIESLSYAREPPRWGIFHHAFADDPDFFEWRDYFRFSHSISIPAHRHVVDNTHISHAYTYNRTAEIAFHSEPESVAQPPYHFPADAIVNSRDLLSQVPLALTTLNHDMAGAMRVAENISDTWEPPGPRKRENEADEEAEPENPRARFRRLSRALLSDYGVVTVLVVADW